MVLFSAICTHFLFPDVLTYICCVVLYFGLWLYLTVLCCRAPSCGHWLYIQRGVGVVVGDLVPVKSDMRARQSGLGLVSLL